jgi:hypothetical protein
MRERASEITVGANLVFARMLGEHKVRPYKEYPFDNE